MSIIEAMAWGLPVVASRVGGIPEVVEEGRTGYLVPSQDADALAKEISHILAEPEVAEAFGRRGMERAHAEFSIEKMVGECIELYERCL